MNISKAATQIENEFISDVLNKWNVLHKYHFYLDNKSAFTKYELIPVKRCEMSPEFISFYTDNNFIYLGENGTNKSCVFLVIDKQTENIKTVMYSYDCRFIYHCIYIDKTVFAVDTKEKLCKMIFYNDNSNLYSRSCTSSNLMLRPIKYS